MPRMTPQEAGRLGGLKGGKSRSEKKLAAARRNGFQKQAATPMQKLPDPMADFLCGNKARKSDDKTTVQPPILFSK